ncbi:MAG: DNA-directed RNA polymerase subunit omega [Ruminococcaceae bacterium]|nr:DNA-directed RNA polymerase subunit omega [Oscillospiraceae bacterium]
MLYPSIMKLMEKAGNRYSLVIAAAKRARMILGESREDEANMDGARSITRAVEEIAEDKILIVNETREQELEREAEDMAKAQALEAAEHALENVADSVLEEPENIENAE